MPISVKLEFTVEVVIKVGVQILFRGGMGVVVGWCVVGWWLDKTKLILITTQVEVVIKAGLEKVSKIDFHG